MNKKRKILVVGMGTSPAVLTETVWALAHSNDPVVPDEIEVITTASGKAALTKAVLDGSPSVMDRLKAALRKEKIDVEGKLVFGTASIKVIPDAKGNELDDLRTGEDNLRAADFMLGELRKYSECSDTTIHCSIAGGRKTMSALLFSCMSLVGREQDKVYHVLLPPEFEGGVEPAFYFPEPGKTYVATKTGKKYKANKVQSELFEVPYVRMRGWYQDKFKSIPPSYRTLISKVQTVAPPAIAYPEIEIDAWNGWVKVNGKLASLSKPCFVMLLFLAQGKPMKELHAKMCALHNSRITSRYLWLDDFQSSSLFNDQECIEDLRHTASNLRNSLSAAGFPDVETLVPIRYRPLTFPLSLIKWHNRDKLADICGCLFIRQK